MWPPQSVKRCRTPSRASTFVTSSPPVTWAIDPLPAPGSGRSLAGPPIGSASSSRAEQGEHVGREALDLLGGPLHAGGEAEHEGAGPGVDEAGQRLGTLRRRAEDPVFLDQLVEGLVVLPGQEAGARAPGPLPVVVDHGEREVGGL